LLAKVEARKTEIELTLARVQAETMQGQSNQRVKALEDALTSVEALLACDLAELPSMVAGQLSQWLDSTKNLATTTLPHAIPQREVAPTVKPQA
jgi:hypothetical protein